MASPDTTTNFNHAEQRWLHRFGWLLGLLGLITGMCAGASLWSAAWLDPRWLPKGWTNWVTRPGLILGAGLALVPLFWRMGLMLESRRANATRRWPVAPFLAVLAVCAAEVAFRLYPSQSLFWQAVRARSGQQHMAREISLLREDAAAKAHQGQRLTPGIVLLGSSQMVYGIDPASLAEQTGRPVYRRAVAGLFLSELVASQDLADFHPGNRLVMMLSGFDLGARDDLYGDAMRPVATPGGMAHLLAAAPPNLLLLRWRTWIDMEFAAGCDLWRSRDYLRFLLQNPFAAYSASPAVIRTEDLQMQKSAYESLGRNPRMVRLCREALRRFLKAMSGRCRQIVVFEGQVNPAYPASTYPALSADMHRFLLEQQALGYIRYVPVAEQQIDLPAEAWRDMTHLNDAGRSLYTAMFARILREPPSAP